MMIANVLVGLIAILHVYILILEMFLWDTPRGRRAFNLSPEQSSQTKVLAANQGLYNGFLAAGLFLGLLLDSECGLVLKLFALGCVAVAGVFGALTSSPKIFFIQTVPAILALVALWARV